jgi:hypothetical protein
MSFEPISDAVYELLMRQGLRPEVAGTTKRHGMKKRAAADEGADPQFAVTNRGVPAGRRHDGVRMGAGCAEENTHPATARRGGGSAAGWEIEQAIHKAMKNGSGRVVRYEPFLMILSGGKR